MAGVGDLASFQLATNTLQNLVQAFSGLNTTVNGAAAKIWDAFAEVDLVYGLTLTPDFSTGFNFSVTLTGNTTLETPTNAKPGQTGVIYITQDGVGSRTMAFSSAWVFVGGTTPVLSTAVNDLDMLFYRVRSPTAIYGNLVKNVRA